MELKTWRSHWKKLIMAGSVVVEPIVVAAALQWWMLVRPLHQPGMVPQGDQLRAIFPDREQADDERRWRGAEESERQHFSPGEGGNGLIIHGGPALSPSMDDFAFHDYDQWGCGDPMQPIDAFSSENTCRSQKTLEQTSGISAQLADTESIRRRLREEKLRLVGHSFGSLLASPYATGLPHELDPPEVRDAGYWGANLVERAAAPRAEELSPPPG